MEREREEVKKKGKKKGVCWNPREREREREREERERGKRESLCFLDSRARPYSGGSREIEFPMITGIASLAGDTNSGN